MTKAHENPITYFKSKQGPNPLESIALDMVEMSQEELNQVMNKSIKHVVMKDVSQTLGLTDEWFTKERVVRRLIEHLSKLT